MYVYVGLYVTVTTYIKEIRELGGGNEVVAKVEKGRRRVGNAAPRQYLEVKQKERMFRGK